MNMAVPMVATLIDSTWFTIVLAGSQLALVMSVVVLLAIWWVEWRHGRVW